MRSLCSSESFLAGRAGREGGLCSLGLIDYFQGNILMAAAAKHNEQKQFLLKYPGAVARPTWGFYLVGNSAQGPDRGRSPHKFECVAGCWPGNGGPVAQWPGGLVGRWPTGPVNRLPGGPWRRGRSPGDWSPLSPVIPWQCGLLASWPRGPVAPWPRGPMAPRPRGSWPRGPGAGWWPVGPWPRGPVPASSGND